MCSNTGIVEVPMGMTLGEIIYDIGGGLQKGKAVQSGANRRALRRLPDAEQHLNTPVDLRLAGEAGHHHGLRRPDRHG